MMNPIKASYSGCYRKTENVISTTEGQIDWHLLSSEFCDKFGVNQSVPVGKINSTGFEFELNYINYWLVLPVVVVIQNGQYIIVTQSYDRKLQWAQIFATTLPLLVGTMFLLSLIDMSLRLVLEWQELFGATAAMLGSFGILGLIVVLRRKLWTRSLEKTENLLKLVGVDMPNSSQISDN